MQAQGRERGQYRYRQAQIQACNANGTILARSDAGQPPVRTRIAVAKSALAERMVHFRLSQSHTLPSGAVIVVAGPCLSVRLASCGSDSNVKWVAEPCPDLGRQDSAAPQCR